MEPFEPFRKDLLAGKTTVITGGGSGLGKSMALRFGALGARVAVLGRRPEPLAETVSAVRAAGGQAAGVPCDVRDPEAVARALDAVEKELGPVNQLINNAAGNFLSASEDLSPNAFNAVVQIVLYGSFHATREVGRRLIAREQPGEILSIVTNYAEMGSAFVLPSAVAKSGVLAMMRSLAVEWATYGIRLNAVAPGPFPTEGAFSRLMPGSEMEKQAKRRIPSKRFGEHWELTNLVAYLMSDASPYQTGDLVTIDGAEALFSGQEFAGFAHLDRAMAKDMMASLKPKRWPHPRSSADDAALLPTSDPETRRFARDAGDLTYTDEGPRDGPALIAVHGIPGTVRDFRYLAPQLSPAVRVVRVDLPGFGGSAPEASGIRSFSGRARAVIALADHLGLAQFAVLGHSMGGATALLTAAAAPLRVNGLVLVASLGLSMHRGLGLAPRVFRLLAGAMKVPGARALLLPQVREQYRRRRFPGFELMTPAQFAVHLRALGATDFAAMRRAVRAPLPPILHAYACDDHMVETHVSEELTEALPGARVLRFPEGGHNLQKTRAVEIGAAIRDLLRAGPLP